MTTSVFSTDEQNEYTDVQAIRRRLVQELTRDGVPKGTADKVLLANLLDGSDRSTFTRVKLRNEKEAAEDTANTTRLVVEALKRIRVKNLRTTVSPSDREIPEHLQHRTFVPGEMEIGNEPLTIGQVMSD